MKKEVMRAAVICMIPPYPIDCGTRLRSWSVITSLKDLGYEVTVIYPALRRNRPKMANNLGVKRAVVVLPGWLERLWREVTRRFFHSASKTDYSYKRVSVGFASKLMLGKLPRFDVAITEYACTSSISRHIRADHHILDTCDILSFYYRKANHLKELVDLRRIKGCDSLGQLKKLPSLKYTEIHPKELLDFKRYDSIIAISENESAVFQQIGLPNIKLIPPCVSMPSKEAHDYSGLPVFPFSGNLFNVQGLIHFKENILPLIIREEPDFRLLITGKPPEEVLNCSHLVCSGYVNDLGEIYRNSGFAIVPVFNGTGQQLKIPELMSYGVAVVSYRMRVDSGVLTHGQGGLLADHESEFKDHVLRLWRDRKLAAEMGGVAEQHAAAHLSQSYFNEKIKELLQA